MASEWSDREARLGCKAESSWAENIVIRWFAYRERISQVFQAYWSGLGIGALPRAVSQATVVNEVLLARNT